MCMSRSRPKLGVKVGDASSVLNPRLLSPVNEEETALPFPLGSLASPEVLEDFQAQPHSH